MSLRAGVRLMRKALYRAFGAIEEHVYEPVPPSPPDEPPPEGYYKLIWYITRWRWRIYVYYSARVRDSARWQKFSQVVRIWGEGTKATDGYSTDTASLVVRNLAEAPSAADAHTIDIDDRVVVNLHEYPSALDGHEVESHYDFRRWLDEGASVEDAVSRTFLQHVTRSLEEHAAVGDTISNDPDIVISKTIPRVVRRLYETARVHETPLAQYAGPWPEDPTKIWWQYYIFEKALLGDSALWFQTINGVRHGSYSDGGIFSYEGVLKDESVSASDAYTADAYGEWWRGIKYDGYSEAEVIYNFVVTKYDGYTESDVAV